MNYDLSAKETYAVFSEARSVEPSLAWEYLPEDHRRGWIAAVQHLISKLIALTSCRRISGAKSGAPTLRMIVLFGWKTKLTGSGWAYRNKLRNG